MSTSRSRRSGSVARRSRLAAGKGSRGPKRSASKRAVDPAAQAFPGTALHRLLILVGQASRASAQPEAARDEYLHVRNPLQVAAELKKRVASLPGRAQKTIAAKVCPEVRAPRKLPLGMLAFVVGLALLATQRFWALPFAAYGAAALIHDAIIWGRFRKRLLTGLDEALKPDFQQLSSDRTRAEAIRERFRETRSLDFLGEPSVPEDLQLPQGERVVLAVDGVTKAKETQAGLIEEAKGKLLVTTARLLFLSGGRHVEMELDKVVRADVVDELRLVVIPSKRESPAIYFALGQAHALKEVIELARKSLRQLG